MEPPTGGFDEETNSFGYAGLKGSDGTIPPLPYFLCLLALTLC